MNEWLIKLRPSLLAAASLWTVTPDFGPSRPRLRKRRRVNPKAVAQAAAKRARKAGSRQRRGASLRKVRS